jgi:hypothetical protein
MKRSPRRKIDMALPPNAKRDRAGRLAARTPGDGAGFLSGDGGRLPGAPGAGMTPVAKQRQHAEMPGPAVLDVSEHRPAPKSVLVIACGALAREVQAALTANGLSHIDLVCLPAQWHNRPEKIAPGVRDLVRKNRGRYAKIAVAYAECGTQGALDKVCAEEGVERIAGPHCYSFYWGNGAFAKREEDDIDAFFLTDFLARQFDAFVVEPLGLDRHPELRDMYFANYRRLVYLAQTDDPELEARARAAAAVLRLSYERRFTGLGDLAPFLQNVATD